MPFLTLIIVELLGNLCYDDFLLENMLNVELAVLAWACYYVSCNPTLLIKSFSMVTMIYFIIVFLISLLPIVYPEWFGLVLTTIYGFALNYQINKNYLLKSMPVNADNVCLVFYVPKRGLKHVFISLFGLPASSFSVAIGGIWARFTKESPMINYFPASEIDDRYIVVDTGVKITGDIREAFNNLKGETAFSCIGCRFKCVKVFSNILNKMGGKWKYRMFDFLPSMYLSRRINNDR